MTSEKPESIDYNESKELIHESAWEITQALLRTQGIDFKIENGEAVCAIRDERTPSCKITTHPKNGQPAGVWYDHGSGDKGDVIALYQHFYPGASFPEALHDCAALIGLKLPDFKKKKSGANVVNVAKASALAKKNSSELEPCPTSEEVSVFAAQYGLTIDDFKAANCKTEKASFPYYGGESGDKKKWVTKWSVKYPLEKADGSTDHRPAKYRTYGRNEAGKREAIHEKKKNGVAPGTGFFPVGQIAKAAKKPDTPLVFTGGEEKALAAIKAGFCAISYSSGEKPPHRNDVLAIRDRFNEPSPRVIIAFDNDDAGRENTQKACKLFQEAGFTVSFVNWPPTAPDKYDLNNLLIDGGVSILRDFLESAETIAGSMISCAITLGDREGYSSNESGLVKYWKIVGTGENAVEEESIISNVVIVITGEIYEYCFEKGREIIIGRIVDAYAQTGESHGSETAKAVKVATGFQISRDDWNDARKFRSVLDTIHPGASLFKGSPGFEGVTAIAKEISKRNKPRNIKKIQLGINDAQTYHAAGNVIVPFGQSEPIKEWYQTGKKFWRHPTINEMVEGIGIDEEFSLLHPESPAELATITRELLTSWPKLFGSGEHAVNEAAATLAMGLFAPYLPELRGQTSARFLFALTGPTGSGKTMRAKILTGLWGHPDLTNQHSTQIGIINTAAKYRHCLYPVEDLRQASKVEYAISILFDGTSRNAATIHGGHRSREFRQPCRCATVFTAESLEDGGESTQNRILHIPVRKLNDEDLRRATSALQNILPFIAKMRTGSIKNNGREYTTTLLSSITTACIALAGSTSRTVIEGYYRDCYEVAQSTRGVDERTRQMASACGVCVLLLNDLIESLNLSGDGIQIFSPGAIIEHLLDTNIQEIEHRKPVNVFREALNSAVNDTRKVGCYRVKLRGDAGMSIESEINDNSFRYDAIVYESMDHPRTIFFRENIVKALGLDFHLKSLINSIRETGKLIEFSSAVRLTRFGGRTERTRLHGMIMDGDD